MQKKRSKAILRWGTITGLACCLGVAAASLQLSKEPSASRELALRGGNNTQLSELATLPRTHETVMVVGGSIARGSLDPHKNSYIRRAFVALGNQSKTKYVYKDRTLIGGTAASRQERKPHEFEGWLKADKPQVVVLAWGLMSDLWDQTPKAKFESGIHTEIQEALRAHAVVFVVTPPVVKALATNRHDAGEALISQEFAVAGSFHSPNVFTFDVFNRMESYMKAHHQTYKMYYGDNWHPNGLGHQVAGRLLYDEFAKTFGSTSIRFHQ